MADTYIKMTFEKAAPTEPDGPFKWAWNCPICGTDCQWYTSHPEHTEHSQNIRAKIIARPTCTDCLHAPVEVTYRAGVSFIGTSPRFKWHCPGCGRDCSRRVTMHPESTKMLALKEAIKKDPRCTICMWRDGDAEPDQVTKLDGFEDE